MFTQTINPNPHVPCQPGWCLQYVNDAFGVPAVYNSATDAWNGSRTKHRDMNFPAGVWVPLWFRMPTEPLGHVVLRAPDGSIYSTSDPATTAHHHPNLENLMAYYAYYDQPLVYLGWTEDVEGTPVIAQTEQEPIVTPEQMETLHKISNANMDTIIKDLTAKQNAQFEALVKLIGGSLNIDESALATALLAKGEIHIEPKS